MDGPGGGRLDRCNLREQPDRVRHPCRLSVELIRLGVFQNAGLMILIGIWGPTTSSVCNLLAIGLVSVIDSVLMGHLPDAQTLLGVAGICVGFGILLWEGEG